MNDSELPVAENLRLGRRKEPVPFYREAVNRRSFLGLTGKLMVFVGLVSLGLSVGMRRARADYPNYNEWKNEANPLTESRCGIYDPDIWYGHDGNNQGWTNYPSIQEGTCSDDACVGTDDALMGAFYCTTCAEANPYAPVKWHFNGTRGNVTYGDFVPSVCDPNGGGPKDAWRWKIDACQGCSPAVYRCHDGWKRHPNGTPELTICQALVACDGAVYQPC